VHTDFLRLDLANRRRLLASCVIGMALYTLVIVVLYPSFKDASNLNDLTKNGSTLAALFGITGSITSPSGWLDANIYQNFLPLIMLLLTIGYGGSSVAGQDEDGTLGLTVTLPESRRSIITQKAGAMILQAATLALAVALCVFVGRSFDLRLDPRHVMAVSLTVLLLGVDIGLVALAVGATTRRRGTALGVGTGVAAASYLVSSLAPVVTWVRPLRYLSVFYWAVGNHQLAEGPSPLDMGVLAGVGLMAFAFSSAAFARADLT
jgi:ABC-2 type transport system permease protein